MPSHPISGRSARAALGATQSAVNRQAGAVVELHTRVAELWSRIRAVEAIQARGFLGRLRWLVLGR